MSLGAGVVRRRRLATTTVIRTVLVATIGGAGRLEPHRSPDNLEARRSTTRIRPAFYRRIWTRRPQEFGSEIQTIFGRYLAQSRALPPLTYSNTQGLGNPPILQGSGYEAVRISVGS